MHLLLQGSGHFDLLSIVSAATISTDPAKMSVLDQNSLKPMTFYRQSAYHLVEQMKLANVQRLVCLTSVGILDEPVGPLFYIWLVKPLLKNIYDDMQHMEQTIRRAG
ncbi:MAG: NAD(P)H-binding protein [Janthinobacterium lividum]